ncbi:hypothetical protein Pcinc_004285 [Petrolisthes cinctipes]|uniref:Uncharacterized protein n=1 Tax=Petrolisthes cinctipes TaxID=88211 RepID=A0AAE1GH55_PETCI|nr:hypothetical protein Pcinc_004285 [Petrolisthes cinctipes]
MALRSGSQPSGNRHILPISSRRGYIYLSYLGSCFHFYVIDGRVVRELVEKLVTHHEEADALIAAHAKSTGEEGCVRNTVFRGSDTDIAVILLHHCWDMNVRINVGTSSKNNRRYLSITSIANRVGHPICSALQECYAFTGCDYTSELHQKGKVRPYAQMLKNTSAQ